MKSYKYIFGVKKCNNHSNIIHNTSRNVCYITTSWYLLYQNEKLILCIKGICYSL